LRGFPDLVAGRQRLIAVFDRGARDRAPQIAADAQTSFDCWVEETAESGPDEDEAHCRDGFNKALAQLEALPSQAAQPAPAAPTRQFQVFFDFDKSNLTPDARRIVDAAASAAKQSNSQVNLVGKADLVGTDAYNQRLSERRNESVIAALVADGIPRDRITARAAGDKEPPVPTPRGVREARNRVVEISLQ
jgi:OOP family OmpA-OmpF porin